MANILTKKSSIQKIIPRCPVFGQCGGCQYQDISYEDELHLKECQLKNLFSKELGIKEDVFDPIVPSGEQYHYRNRLDLRLMRTKQHGILIGFTIPNRKFVIPINACYIARREISDFLPELKKQAIERLPDKYRMANLVVRSGEEKRVQWGGIGRRSCQLSCENYFWTKIKGKKVFYSLDTFFQANLSILPKLINKIESLDIWQDATTFFDLYGGVGLFGIAFFDNVRKVVLIEESEPSIKVARVNREYNNLKGLEIVYGKVEDHLPEFLKEEKNKGNVAFIDPPRAGLSTSSRELLSDAKDLKALLYLSCHPESLVCDLKVFIEKGWMIKKVVPFDFFPRTKHLETLVVLNPI